MSRFNTYLEQVESGTHMGYEKDPEIFGKDKAKAKEAEEKAINAILTDIRNVGDKNTGEGKSEANMKAELVKKLKEPGIYAKALIKLYKSGKKEFRYTDIVKALLYVTTNGRIEYRHDWHRGVGAQNLNKKDKRGGVLENNFDKQPNGKWKFKESKLESLKDGSIQPFSGQHTAQEDYDEYRRVSKIEGQKAKIREKHEGNAEFRKQMADHARKISRDKGEVK